MLTQEIANKLADLLDLDSPENYQCLGDAQESIAGEFDLDVETHDEICDRVEDWWNDWQ